MGAGVLAGVALTEGDQLALKVAYPFEVSRADSFEVVTCSLLVGERGSRLETSCAHARSAVGTLPDGKPARIRMAASL